MQSDFAYVLERNQDPSKIRIGHRSYFLFVFITERLWSDRIVLCNNSDIRKDLDVNFPENVATEFDLTCNECCRVCLSKVSLRNHQWRYTLTQIETIHCTFCNNLCKWCPTLPTLPGLKKNNKKKHPPCTYLGMDQAMTLLKIESQPSYDTMSATRFRPMLCCVFFTFSTIGNPIWLEGDRIKVR